jgi:hypothetical protein
MPDGVSVSQSVSTWQARPTCGRWRRSLYRSNCEQVRSFYARGRATGARKNPGELELPRGRFVVATTGNALTGFPVSWPLSLPPQHQRCRDDSEHHTNRF